MKQFFWSANNDLRTYDNIRKIRSSQGVDQTTNCFIAYFYFKEHGKLIAIDLSKQQKLDVDLREMQQFNFTWSLAKNAAIFFIIEEANKTVFDFSKET